MSKDAGKKTEARGIERRHARRRPVLNTFSLFVVIPKKGPHRLQIHDVSDLGMGFDIDTEGEAARDFPTAVGETVDLRFYFNQSLYLPLTVQLMRVEEKGAVRRVGVEFKDRGGNDKGYKAFLSFLQMLDDIVEAVRFDGEPG